MHFLGYMFRNRIVQSFSTLVDNAELFSKVAVPNYTPICSVCECPSFHILANIWNFSPVGKCRVTVFHYAFTLHSHDYLWGFTCSAAIWISAFDQLLKYFVHILIEVSFSCMTIAVYILWLWVLFLCSMYLFWLWARVLNCNEVKCINLFFVSCVSLVPQKPELHCIIRESRE